MMKIKVGGLSEGVHNYHFEAQAGELSLTECFTGQVVVEVDLDRTGNELHLNAAVRTVGTFVCDRCAGEFERPITAKYQMYYLPESPGYAHVDPAELQLIPAGFSVIDIAEDVRQTVLLAVPLKMLCSEGCAGLCPQCGANLNMVTCSCCGVSQGSRLEDQPDQRG